MRISKQLYLFIFCIFVYNADMEHLMQNIFSVLYLFVFAASGICIVKLSLPSEKPIRTIWLGCVFGLVLLLWLPALFSFLFGFTLFSQILALVLAALIGAVCAALAHRRNVRSATASWKEERHLLWTLLPLFLFGTVLFCTHTIREVNGALYVGQSTYGDLSMHLGFITSISEQTTFPPMYSICPDTSVGYPFLSDSISSTFYTLGASLRFATLLPALYAYALVLYGVYACFEAWFNKKNTVLLATLLFFIGGGFGFVYFFDIAQFEPGKLAELMSGFYVTPTNYTSVGLRWVNPIADMLIPQRATLFGWALLFPCLHLLIRAALDDEYRLFIPLGIIAGCMPLVHTHSFLALGMISAFYLVRSVWRHEGGRRLRGFLIYAGIALALAGPQLFLFTFKQSSGFLRLNWNWDNVSDTFLWFYIKNLGLLFILAPVACITADRRSHTVFGSMLPLWIIAETIQFQPNAYDNNKLLFVCFAMLCGLIADFLIRVYQRLRNGAVLRDRIALYLMSVLVMVVLFLSGTLTLLREYVSEYQLFSSAEVEASEYVRENTQADATFLTHNNHNNTIAALTGRNIVCGSGSFLYFHGVDYSDREKALRLIYEEPELYFDSYVAEYGIDYVYLSAQEYTNYAVNEDYFCKRFPIIYDRNGIRIYQVTQDP